MNYITKSKGDIWDAQKDMALAMLGSTLSGLYILLFKKNKLKS